MEEDEEAIQEREQNYMNIAKLKAQYKLDFRPKIDQLQDDIFREYNDMKKVISQESSMVLTSRILPE